MPKDFIGIGVASNADASTDDYVITQLRALGINQVRLDFTYGDFEQFNARFLSRLIAGAISGHTTPHTAICQCSVDAS